MRVNGKVRGAALYIWIACAVQAVEETPLDCLRRGDTHLDAQEYERAIVEYTRALQWKPDYAEALDNRAYAYYSKYDGTGNPLADLNRAISLRACLKSEIAAVIA